MSMKIKKTKKSINNLILFIFLTICIFFPADPYGVKLIAFALLFVLNGKLIVRKIGDARYRPVLIFGSLFPITIMLQSIMLTGNVVKSISSAYSPVLLLLLIPIIEIKLSFKKYVLILLKTMSVCVLLIAITDVIGVFNVNRASFIRDSFYKYGMGVMGKSAAYSSYYRIFFKASPLLVLLLDDSISKGDYKWLVASFGALWFTGTRANVFSALIIIFFRYVIWSDSKKTTRYLIAVAILALSLLNISRIYNMIVGQMNTTGAIASDFVRSGELLAYKEVFSDPIKLILGTGFGSPFYNYGRDSIGYTSELSYFEMIRCVGLIFAIPFFLFVLKPVFSKKVKADYKLSYICYLVIAATNPLLFSSTAMIMYMFLYEDIIKPNERQDSFESSIDKHIKKRIVLRLHKT